MINAIFRTQNLSGFGSAPQNSLNKGYTEVSDETSQIEPKAQLRIT